MISGTSGNLRGHHKPIIVDLGFTTLLRAIQEKSRMNFGNNISRNLIIAKVGILRNEQIKKTRAGKSLTSIRLIRS